MKENSNLIKVAVASAILAILAGGFFFYKKQTDVVNKPSQECLVPPPPDGSPVESTCPDAKIECHWQVLYCDEWYDAPTDCAKLSPPAEDINYGTVTWENYYCGCDMKCHPKGECKNGKTSDMVQQKCSAKYGWGECPSGAFTCYWKDVNDSNVHCPVPKCCGGWCSAWSPC